MSKNREIRQSQGITTFGVGAIISTEDESFINQDITRWYGPTIEIRLERLERALRKNLFKQLKPITKSNFNNKGVGRLPFFRFPRWLFCSKCRKMEYISNEKAKSLNGSIPTCMNPNCKGRKLTPMRFVVVCEKGHISDFPWFEWAHSDRNSQTPRVNCQKNRARLKYEFDRNKGASYDANIVTCLDCGGRRSLSGLERKDALKQIGLACSGRQPWDRVDNRDDCGETPWMQQKNSSSIYQPVLISAIDIPKDKTKINNDSLSDEIKAHPEFKTIKKIYDTSNDPNISYLMPIIEKIANSFNCSEENIINLLTDIPTDDNHNKDDFDLLNINQKILLEEWPKFFENINTKEFINTPEELFVNGDSELLKNILNPLIGHISLVKKLREVRVFRGFNRLKFDPGTTVPADLGYGKDWLPAIEVFGEGIFISINQSALDDWYISNEKQISEDVAEIKNYYEHRENSDWAPDFSVKFILLHTLSHLLISQLAFESGYSSSSLRESIYFSDDKENRMAGILIYTADSDAEGSLGGLVRQGKAGRFIPTLISSLKKATWCSADPVCGETKTKTSYNQAACHSCALIAETSCTYMNTLLNRKLLLDQKTGFFKDLVDEINKYKL